MVSLFPTKRVPLPAVPVPSGSGSISIKGLGRFGASVVVGNGTGGRIQPGSPPKKKAVARELTATRSLKKDDM